MADKTIEKGEARGGGFPWRLLIFAGLIVFGIIWGTVVWLARRIEPVSSRAITTEFREYLPTVGAADGILETATASVPETFTQSDSATLLNVIPLGTTVSEIRVPAVYRYHIRLYDPWKLVMSGNVCLVMAPQFQPSLPPAIITGEMEKSSSNGWLRFNGDDDLTNLEQRITGELEKRAGDKEHRDFVREACRQAVGEFVKSWLMKEDFWKGDGFRQVVVVFPDEVTNGEGGGVKLPAVTVEGTGAR